MARIATAIVLAPLEVLLIRWAQVPGWWLPAAVLAALGATWLALRGRPRREALIRYLDRHVPELEESSELLLSPRESSDTCLSCHQSYENHFSGRQARHRLDDVGCLDCHAAHSPEVGMLACRILQHERPHFFDSVGLYDDSGARETGQARQWLQALGIAALARHYYHEISFGQQRLVLLG